MTNTRICAGCNKMFDYDAIFPIEYQEGCYCQEECLPDHVVRPSEFGRRLPHILLWAAVCGIAAVAFQTPWIAFLFMVGFFFIGGAYDQNKDKK